MRVGEHQYQPCDLDVRTSRPLTRRLLPTADVAVAVVSLAVPSYDLDLFLNGIDASGQRPTQFRGSIYAFGDAGRG